MEAIIIDVRTEKEFKEQSYPGAINIPLNSMNVHQIEIYRDNHISLLCNSGNRARKAQKILVDNGFSNVSILQNQMIHILEKTDGKSTLWSVDRQFRLALGILIGLSLSLSLLFFSITSLVILSILCAGLIFSAITDNCYLKELITLLPWNRKPTIEHEEVNTSIVVEPSL